MELEAIPGVGAKTAEALRSLDDPADALAGVRTVGQTA
ncbi:hypothetical protein, partial [Halobacterium bonnevillei]